MTERTQIFKTVIRSVDATNGTLCLKGLLADETNSLNVTSLVPYFTRDIFLIQKDEPLLKARISFKVIAGIKWPCIMISISEGMNEENFKKVQQTLIQILWSYNFLTYDAKSDRYQQRFSYVFAIGPICQSSAEEAA